MSLSLSPANNNLLIGKLLLFDLQHKPFLTLEAELPRSIFRQGRTSVFYFFFSFAVGTLLSVMFIYLFIDKWLTTQELANAEIEHLAYHDALTGLPNRALLKEFMVKALSNAQRRGNISALMFMDLDRFKQVNDTYGHAQGDALLTSVAQWLTTHVRQGDMVARLGGDEFVIFLASLKDAHEARLVAQKLCEIWHHPFDLSNNQVFISGSIGIALAPEDGNDPESLQQLADMAMYEAKQKGPGLFQFASTEMNLRVQEQNRMEADLRQALREDELHLAFQPLIDTISNEVSRVEALLRWTHPEKGEIPPNKFIPLAEESGLIHSLGEWVLRTVCRQLKQWGEQQANIRRVAINLSGLELNRSDFIEMVDKVVAETGVDPQLLEYELTESVLMDDIERVQKQLNLLRERGISIAIDDFGTGYSSLSYLKSFPIERIKIDRTFVGGLDSDMENQAIVEAVIAMATSLKMGVSAEGVETAQQLAILKAKGCTEMQGFYFARPMVAEELVKYQPGPESP